jgi:hypothetical protein
VIDERSSSIAIGLSGLLSTVVVALTGAEEPLAAVTEALAASDRDTQRTGVIRLIEARIQLVEI